jgi:hypothetical protein
MDREQKIECASDTVVLSETLARQMDQRLLKLRT